MALTRRVLGGVKKCNVAPGRLITIVHGRASAPAAATCDDTIKFYSRKSFRKTREAIALHDMPPYIFGGERL